MYHYQNVMQGIEEYVNKEILDKINGWQKWVIGTGIEMALEKSSDIYGELKDNDIVKMLKLIDEDMVDVDELYKHLKHQADKESVEINIPLMGKLKLDSTDVDKLYQYIKKN